MARLPDLLGDRYAIERELGRGGMAVVYLARDIRHDRQVAVKVLLPDLALALGAERFLREIQIASKLTHPHILPVHDSGEAGGFLYYVMPYIEGETLRDRIDRERQLPIDDALRLTCEVASALAHAHSMGVVHRDIKPENILLKAGHAVVADFGIARAISGAAEGSTLTKTGMSLGTPAYMSPEQAMGERDIDGRSDQYSLACVTYEMLAGQPPFTANNQQALIARHLVDDVPLITTVRKTVSDEVEDVIMTALAKSRADRFPTVQQFGDALASLSGGTGTWARQTGRISPTTRRHRVPAQPRRHMAYGVAAVLALALALGALWYRQSARRASAVVDSGAPPDRIAVMYFDAVGRAEELGPVADGLTEGLIEQLDRVAGLDVISANGVARFRGVDRDSVASALKVGTLVTGTVEQEGGKVRVAVQMIDARSGAPFERASFTRPSGDLLAIRDTLAQEVARLLRGHLGEEVRLRELKAGTASQAAWTLVQRAERLRKDAEAARTAGDVPKATAHLASADSLLAAAANEDANWLKPIVLRGVAQLQRARLEKEVKRAAPLLDSAYAHAERALAREPRNAEALELRGTLRHTRVVRGVVRMKDDVQRAIDGAEADLAAAVEIAPDRATAWNALSQVQYAKQNVVASNNYARRAYEADAYLTAAPDILWRLFATSYDLEVFADAIRWCDEGGFRFPNQGRFIRCQLLLLGTKAREPDVNEAWRLTDSLKKLTPPQEWEYQRREAAIFTAAVLGRAGLADSAKRVLTAARAGTDIDPRGELIGLEAFVRAQLGEIETAIQLLQRFVAEHPEHRGGFSKANAWWWRPLQNDPRFRTLAGSGT